MASTSPIRTRSPLALLLVRPDQPGRLRAHSFLGGNAIVVSALSVRTGFGKLLRRVEDEHRSLVIEKRGTPKAVLLSIRDYVRLAAPEPDVLRAIGEESKRKGTDKLTSRQIDQAIAAVRTKKPKRG